MKIGKLILFIALFASTTLAVEPPGILNYQGLVNVNGAAFTGTGQFKFALVDAAGATTYWSNDGTSAGGSEPSAAVSLAVSGGRYSVALGDTTVANMTTVVPASVFANHADVRLRVWFNDGTNGFQLLSPDQRLASVGYALNAASATTAENVNATNITGALSLPQLPSVLVTNGASGVNISGTFSGDGADVTNVNLLYANTQGAITFSTSYGFVLASSPGVGGDPVSVTAADVNGDGHPDLISANHLANSLTVLTNNGSGGFVKAASPGVGSRPDSVIAADVNGDGHPDLIAANQNANTLTVLTNDGRGGFVLASSPDVGLHPVSVTVADVNDDHHLDLIAANQNANTLTVLTNDGSGGFATASSPGVGNGPHAVTTADVNGDGHPDLIAANQNANTLTVLTNDGSGGFATASSPGVGDYPASVTVADVNGDGHPDLISANALGYSLTVLTNDGSGGFVTSSSPHLGYGPSSIAAADVNGDGYPDLIVADPDNLRLTVLTNNGSGRFATASTSSVGDEPQSVTMADVNGDGLPDLICANDIDSDLTVLFNVATVSSRFTGDGSGLTGLNAGNLTGSVPAALLTSVPANNLTGTVSLVQLPTTVLVTNDASGVSLSGRFSGDGGGLTNLNADNLSGSIPATNLTGTISPAQLPSAVVANHETGVTLGGTFSGDGSGLTNLNAGNLSGGTVALAQLPAVLVTNGATGTTLSGTFSGDGAGLTNVPGDNLGDHVATKNLRLNGHWLSGDGGNEGVFVDGDGNVGIGTSSPASRLAVRMQPSLDTLLLGSETLMQVSAGAHLSGSGPLIGLAVDLSASSADTNYAATFLGGNVGIGTTNPAAALQVEGTVKAAGLDLTSPGSTVSATLTKSDNSHEANVVFNGSGTTYNFGTPTADRLRIWNSVSGEVVTVLTNGNVGIGVTGPTHKLQVAGDVAATTFVTTSDRNAKQDFQPVSPTEVLRKVAALPITTWQFKTGQDGRHLGPMAQDFHAAFGLGNTDKGIATVDEDGVALAAIQGLNEKLESGKRKAEIRSQNSEVRIQKLEAENTELKQQLKQLIQTVNKLSRKINGDAR